MLGVRPIRNAQVKQGDMSRSHRNTDRYIERQRALRIVGVVAVAAVGVATAILVFWALTSGP